MDAGKVAIIILISVLLGPLKAFADKFNLVTASEARSLGMGDAGINTVRGPFGAFYNPANIAAKNTGAAFQVVNFQVEANEGQVSQYGQSQLGNPLSLSDTYSNLQNYPNTYVNSRFSLYPNVTLRNFSVGLLYEVNQGAMVRASDNALIVKARNRFAPTAALSFRLLSGVLRLGASAQLLTIGNADTVLLPPINNPAYKDVIEAGTGLLVTGGMTLTLPVRFLPSFSVVARSIPRTNYVAPPIVPFGTTRTSLSQDMTFDFASSMTFYLANRVEIKVEGDYRDTVNKLGGNKLRHVFAGTEAIFFDLVRLRAGYMHGYPTAGFGLKTAKASLDLAWYSDEIEDRLRARRDQRFVLQYTYNFFGSTR